MPVDESVVMPEEVLADEPQQPVEDIRPVERGFAEKLEAEVPPPKVLGEFENEEHAKSELAKLREIVGTVAKDRDYQMLMEQRRQAEIEQQKKSLALQQDEESLLTQYADAIKQGDPAKAVLTLVRNIRSQAYNDAQAAIQNEIAQLQKPAYDKAQLLENRALADLHPVADDAVWLAQRLEPAGVPKKDIAEFIRRVGLKYAMANDATLTQIKQKVQPQRQQRGRYTQLEEPASDSGWGGKDEKSFDKWVDQYWSDQGY